MMKGNFGSAVFSVADLCKNRAAHHSKRARPAQLRWFLDSFPPFVEMLADDKEFTNAELYELPYARYLESRLHRSYRTPTISRKGKRHVVRKMRDAIALFNDIRDFGLKSPLDMVYENNRLVLYRGGRRLVILAALGYSNVPVRRYKNRKVYVQHNASPKWTSGYSGDSIADVAAKQFALLQERATDKYWVHGYIPMYDRHIGHLRNSKKFKILELGVATGASLGLWREAFPHAEIYGVDKDATSWQKNLEGLDRIKVFVGNQKDDAFIQKVVAQGPYNVVIDDASHHPRLQRKMLEAFWPVTQNVYVVEDLRSGSYVRRWKLGADEPTMVDSLGDWVDAVHTKADVRSITHYYDVCFIER